MLFDYDPVPDSFNNIIRELPVEFTYLNNLKDLLTNRPLPEYALDQSHADFSTVVKKVLYLLKKGDIEGRKIIFLGDDDVISLALGLTKLADEIIVVDIDKRVLEFVSESAGKLDLKNISVLNQDLRESCPKIIMNKYDIVVMDPPYTIEGLRLFLKRARQVIKSRIKINNKVYPIIGKKCLLSFGNKPPEQTQILQSSILDHGFIINEMLPDFNHYKGPTGDDECCFEISKTTGMSIPDEIKGLADNVEKDCIPKAISSYNNKESPINAGYCDITKTWPTSSTFGIRPTYP